MVGYAGWLKVTHGSGTACIPNTEIFQFQIWKFNIEVEVLEFVEFARRRLKNKLFMKYMSTIPVNSRCKKI
jgi:hypothetical protein